MGLFCLSRHLRLLFRSQSRSGGVERVRGRAAVVMCVQMFLSESVFVIVACDVAVQYVIM